MICLLQYLDKNGINYASVYGLEQDTKLESQIQRTSEIAHLRHCTNSFTCLQDYSWLSSIFYFGYMISQYPTGYLMQRLPTAKILGFATLGGGIILITTPACHNFAGFAVNRFLLGVLEATVNPLV